MTEKKEQNYAINVVNRVEAIQQLPLAPPDLCVFLSLIHYVSFAVGHAVTVTRLVDFLAEARRPSKVVFKEKLENGKGGQLGTQWNLWKSMSYVSRTQIFCLRVISELGHGFRQAVQ